MIKNAVFNDLSTSENGAAICCSGRNIEIFCCQFVSNSVEKNGGSIYFTDGDIKIYRSLFFKCYSSAKVDNTYIGNAIYIYSNKVIINEVSTRLSGESEELCTDTSIFISKCKSTLFEINASNNYGYGGSSVFRIDSSIDGTKITYIQGYNY